MQKKHQSLQIPLIWQGIKNNILHINSRKPQIYVMYMSHVTLVSEYLAINKYYL